MSTIPIDPSSQDYDDETGELDPEWSPIPEEFREAWEEIEKEEAATQQAPQGV